MSTSTAGVVFIVALLAALVAVYRRFGDYMYRVATGTKHPRVERGIYRLVGVNPEAEQSWGVYARSLLALSAVSLLFLYLILRVNWALFGPAQDFPGVTNHIAWNTAVSFVTNTNWQAYSGESTLTYLSQMAGLAVQNFVSAAVGLAVALTLIRRGRRQLVDGPHWTVHGGPR